MTDLTRLLASLKRRAAHAKELGHDVLFVKIEDIDALVEALEKAQQQNKSDFEIKARLCKESNSLHDRLRVAEKRISELESLPVTVKLPEIERPIDGTGYAKAAGAQYYKECVIKALTAQGIKWEAE